MKFSLLLLSLVFSFLNTVHAEDNLQLFKGRHQAQPILIEPARNLAPTTDDQSLVQAVAAHRNVSFLEAANLKVVSLEKDDHSGLPHQKFTVITSSGAKVLCVYNLDQGQRIPLKVGDEVDLGGEFKWTNIGPLMHWLHADSSNHRPDGYVDLAGHRYGLN